MAAKLIGHKSFLTMHNRLNKKALFCVALLVGFLSVSSYAETHEAPDTLYKRGLGSFAAQDYTTAAQAFQELIERFGSEPSLEKEMESVYYALGCSYYNLGDYPSAITTFESYAQRYPQARFLDEAIFRIAAAQQSLENYNEAIATYERLVREHPKSLFAEDAAFQIGVCYLIQEDFDNAAKIFDSFQRGFSDSELVPQAAVFQARCLFQLGKLGESLDALDRLAKHSRKLDHIAYGNFLAMEIGDMAYEDTDYDTALRAYRHVRTKNSLLRIQRKHVNRLQRALRRLEKQRPSPQHITERFRRERRLRSTLSQARDILQMLESMPDYDAGLFHRIGRCFLNSDRFWEARVAFTRVVDEATDEKIREAAQFDLVLVIVRLRQFGDVIEEATRYLMSYGDNKTFIESGHVPTVAFLRAEAYVNQELFEEAEPELKKLLADYPNHNQKARIEFYIALCAAMQERFDESIRLFDIWTEMYPATHPLQTEVAYWLPIALYYNGNYSDALPLFTSFYMGYPLSVYAPEAEYRAALCKYSMEDFKGAAIALGGWLEKYPDHYFKWEAQLTRADALAAAGMLDQAEENYLRVTKEAGPFYFLALTQLAKVYRALGTDDAYRRMANVFAKYIRAEPESGNVINAAYQAGWALRQIDRSDDARKLYWTTIDRYGDRRAWEGFDALFKDMSALYADMPEGSLKDDLEAHYRAALNEHKATLASRLKLAQIRAMPEEDQSAELRRFLIQFKPKVMGPETLAYLGSVFRDEGKPENALKYFEQILDEFPESHLTPLANTRVAEGLLDDEQYDSAFSNAVLAVANAGDPTLLMEATFVLGKSLLALGQYDEAKEAFTTVLASRTTPRHLKPEALLDLGECMEKQGETLKAIPYYQRVYVMYAAYTNAVAEAYLRSGKAFEAIGDREAAIRTYQEMLDTDSLKERPEINEAEKQLRRLAL